AVGRLRRRSPRPLRSGADESCLSYRWPLAPGSDWAATDPLEPDDAAQHGRRWRTQWTGDSGSAHLGKRHVDDAVVAKLRRRLDPNEKKSLLKGLHYAPQWIADVMRQIATTDG